MSPRIASSVLASLVVVAPALLSAQSATFSGTVLVDPTEKPIANAEIVITSLNRAVRSDSSGNFTMTALPAGKYSIQVRMPGFDTFTSDLVLKDLQTVEVDLLLKPTTQTLAPVAVKATAAAPSAARMEGFDERVKSSGGRFITAEEFQKADGRPVSAIIAKQLGSGVKIIQSNGRRILTSGRQGDVRISTMVTGATPPAAPPGINNVASAVTETSLFDTPNSCYMMVIVNGIVRYNGSQGQPYFDVDHLDPKDILGFELHNTATMPAQYNGTAAPGTASCGLAIIWTKGG
ncbi:MAG: carboxypeptidase-like regulatory domain-containing protein [Gemmatimonas sp.]